MFFRFVSTSAKRTSTQRLRSSRNATNSRRAGQIVNNILRNRKLYALIINLNNEGFHCRLLIFGFIRRLSRNKRSRLTTQRSCRNAVQILAFHPLSRHVKTVIFCRKLRVVKNLLKKFRRSWHALNTKFLQSATHTSDSSFTTLRSNNKFAHHRIEFWRNIIANFNTKIDANTRTGRPLYFRQSAGTWSQIRSRIFRSNAKLEAVSARLWILNQLAAVSNIELFSH